MSDKKQQPAERFQTEDHPLSYEQPAKRFQTAKRVIDRRVFMPQLSEGICQVVQYPLSALKALSG